MLRKIFGIALLVFVSFGAIVWIADWALLRLKMSRDSGLGQVDVQKRYEVKLKNRRIEQRMEKRHPEECVRSLFPHYGDNPCWYVARHAHDVEEIDSSAWHFYYE